MPVTINEIESQVEVESGAPPAGESSRSDNAAEALQRWQELARLQAQREMRTAAWGFDD